MVIRKKHLETDTEIVGVDFEDFKANYNAHSRVYEVTPIPFECGRWSEFVRSQQEETSSEDESKQERQEENEEELPDESWTHQEIDEWEENKDISTHGTKKERLKEIHDEH